MWGWKKGIKPQEKYIYIEEEGKKDDDDNKKINPNTKQQQKE